MFKNLLVPLDGSPMAEAALSVAAVLAARLGATLNLMHVIERGAPKEVHGQPHLCDAVEAQQYLIRTADSLSRDLRIERHVHASGVRDVPQSIEEHAADLEDIMVVMCTHGRSGLGSLLVGSIAQRVAAEGAMPVLLVPPDGQKEFALRRIMVPLDGDEAHECGLPAVEELARACAAAIHLVMVVPTRAAVKDSGAPAAILLPRTTNALLRIAAESGAEYLEGHAKRLTAAGFTVTTDLRRGDPDPTIVECAGDPDVDMTVLCTHRKAGMDAFFSGSVAPRVAAYAKKPVLLIPIREGA